MVGSWEKWSYWKRAMIVQPGTNRVAHKPCPRRAASLIEVLTVLSIIAFLLSLLLPSFRQAREQVRRLLCANNLRQWGNATQYYREDNNDYLPTEGTYWNLNKSYTWFNVLPPYLNAPRYIDVERMGKQIKEFPALHVWICPSKNISKYFKSRSGYNQFHYGMNLVLDGVGRAPRGSKLAPGFPDQGDNPIQASLFARKPSTVYMFDIFPNASRGMQGDVGTSYHHDYGNVLYMDTGIAHFRAKDFVTNGDYRNGQPIWDHPDLYWGYRPPSS